MNPKKITAFDEEQTSAREVIESGLVPNWLIRQGEWIGNGDPRGHYIGQWRIQWYLSVLCLISIVFVAINSIHRIMHSAGSMSVMHMVTIIVITLVCMLCIVIIGLGINAYLVMRTCNKTQSFEEKLWCILSTTQPPLDPHFFPSEIELKKRVDHTLFALAATGKTFQNHDTLAGIGTSEKTLEVITIRELYWEATRMFILCAPQLKEVDDLLAEAELKGITEQIVTMVHRDPNLRWPIRLDPDLFKKVMETA